MIRELYKIDNKNKVRVWSAWNEGSAVVTSHGVLGGKLQKPYYEAEAKNQGRSNATTATEQAIVEVLAMYQDQEDNKHYRTSIEGAQKVKSANKIPRKILNYNKGFAKLPERCITSIKLNGSRACIIDGILYSKIGRPEDIKINLLREGVARLHSLGLANVDCEVFSKELPLQRIRAAWLKPVRTNKEVCEVANKRFNLKGKDRILISAIAIDKLGYDPNQDAQKLKFHIFDEPMNSDMGYEQRILNLECLEETIQGEPLLQNCFEMCEWVATYSHEQRLQELDKVCAMGYEGLVHYDPDGVYEFGKRSDNAQKAKPRYSGEALVTGVSLCKNLEGKLELRCSDKLDSVEFTAMMKGKHEDRMYEVQQQFIGQWVTFDYEELSIDGCPTKGVVRETRLCDTSGNPIQ